MLCGEDVGPILGFRVGTRSKGEMGEVYSRLYKLDERPTVINVIAGGAAERAGLKARDVINKMNGVDSADRTAITSMLKSLPSKESVNLLIRRDGVDMNVSIQPEIGCKYPIQTSDEQVINAYADGEKIVIAMGMMNFARDDNELALVVAHELAHNTMKHIEAKKKNMGAGLLADLAVILISRGQVSNTQFTQAGANSYSQEFEAEADYVGLYIMANAGLPIKDAPSFWRRMATAHPGSIKTNHAASHPSTAYRMVALEEAVKEIETKIAKNEPLIPNEKKVK
jgi:membrane-associated protease RseP (regulator of RpoE activity)